MHLIVQQVSDLGNGSNLLGVQFWLFAGITWFTIVGSFETVAPVDCLGPSVEDWLGIPRGSRIEKATNGSRKFDWPGNEINLLVRREGTGETFLFRKMMERTQLRYA